MNTFSCGRRLLTGVAASAALVATLGGCQTKTTLPDDVAELARQIGPFEPMADEQALTLPPLAPAPGLVPANEIRAVRDDLQALAQAIGGPAGAQVADGAAKVDESWLILSEGSRDLSHLGETARRLGAAQETLDAAAAAYPALAGRLEPIGDRMALIARSMARDLLERARIAGLDGVRLRRIDRLIGAADFAIEEGDTTGGYGGYGGAMDEAASPLSFDPDAFRDAIVAQISGNAVGFSLAIAVGGELFDDGDAEGLARTSADGGPLAQSITKESQVASVSKFVSAIVIHRLLQENGLTAEAEIGPFLPSAWAPSASAAALTFEDVMRHQTGFAMDLGSTPSLYNSLETQLQPPVTSPGFTYANSNFGLLRVLAAGLMGIDPSDGNELPSDVIAASAFQIAANDVFDEIGVDVACASNDPNPMIQYNFPAGNSPGYEEPERHFMCGGFGWFVSATELAAIITNLRNTQNLLNTASRTAMQSDFMGFLDPAWGWNWVTGEFGVYYMHGGDWNHTPGEVHTCVAAFPNAIEAALIVNSERAFTTYQCQIIRDAYDAAWSTN